MNPSRGCGVEKAETPVWCDDMEGSYIEKLLGILSMTSLDPRNVTIDKRMLFCVLGEKPT